MKKLEKDILKGVYVYETRQTLSQLFFRLLAIISFTIAGILWLYLIVQTLISQQTLDVFDIFREDLEVIRENFWEVFGIFTEEAPITEIILAIFTLVLPVFLTVKFIQNFAKVKNKLNSIIKFWFSR